MKQRWPQLAIVIGVALFVWGLAGWRGGSSPNRNSIIGGNTRSGFPTDARVAMASGASLAALGLLLRKR